MTREQAQKKIDELKRAGGVPILELLEALGLIKFEEKEKK